MRDTKGNANEAVRVARELILRENVDFLVGTLTSAEGPGGLAGREGEQDRLRRAGREDRSAHHADNLHPYVFRMAANTTIEGRTRGRDHGQVEQVKRVATMSPDYAYGQDVTRAFVTHLKKLARTSRSSTSSGRSSARPTTRPSSTRRWPRSRRRCSPACGAAIS